MSFEPTEQFYDPGVLWDGELELVLVETCAAIPEKGWVPEYKFEMRHESGEKVGSLRFRTYLTEQLASYGGHIGYEVEPEYRGASFAARSCRLLFPLAARHGIEELLITCAPDNVASRRTIEKIGGRLSRIAKGTTEEGEKRDTCYYFIRL